VSLDSRNRRRKRHDVRRVLLATLGGMLGAATLVGAHSFTLVRDQLRADNCDAIKLGLNTKIFDRNGALLSTIAAENNRDAIPLSEMPKHLLDATVAIEDKRFYQHDGIDYNRVIGAAIKDLGSGASRQGGSTLTMQLMKNLCHPRETRSLSLKLEEAYLAKSYEKAHSKQNILQRYLNSVFYGNNAIGVQAASLTYFNRPASKLTLAQAALLAGLPQAPSAYNPFQNPRDATTRRNLVLTEMAKEGYITSDEAQRAQRSGLGLQHGNAFGLKREGYYVDYVEGLLKASLGDKKTKEGGYRVYTTINPRLQRAARKAMRDTLAGFSNPPSAAIVMIEAKTGRVLAMASSEEYNRKNQFNVAGPTAHRQAGSTFKAFVLTTAIKQGVSPNTHYFSKSPIKSNGQECHPPVPFDVSTYSNKGAGMLTIAGATTRSDNSVYAQMTCDLGPPNVYDTAREMGITSLVPSIDQYTISMGLGGLNRGVNVLEMARAYAPLANGGYRVRLLPMTKLVRADGKVTVFEPQRTKIFSDGVSAEVTKILRANVLGGTGTRANLPNVPVAGKTGTTSDFVDAWFVGYTPKYVTAVWMGYPDERISMPGVTGGTYPAKMWHDFMAVATAGESGQSFPAATEAVEFRPFDGYWARQAAALAAADAKAKADAAAKAKADAAAKKKKKKAAAGQGAGGGTPGAPPPPGTPTTGTPAPGTPTPTTPAPPPTTP
jgi:penicillin-binding protein 1A